MDVLEAGAGRWTRFLWALANVAIWPSVFGAIGFAYIGIPSELQASVRRLMPSSTREAMLKFYGINKWMLILFGISVFFALWGVIGSGSANYFIKKSYRKLRSEFDSLRQAHDSKTIDCYCLFSDYLYGISARLELGVNERLSLYRVDLDQYSCIGRFSEHGVFNSKPTRFYPQKQGCIAKAWAVGSVNDGNFPDPNTEFDKYLDYNKKNYNISPDDTKRMRMKSRSFAAYRLQNLRKETVAVLIFESIDSAGLKFSKINKAIDEHEKHNLCGLIESLEFHMPSLTSAHQEGF